MAGARFATIHRTSTLPLPETGVASHAMRTKYVVPAVASKRTQSVATMTYREHVENGVVSSLRLLSVVPENACTFGPLAAGTLGATPKTTVMLVDDVHAYHELP
jgi:hypothetical protein